MKRRMLIGFLNGVNQFPLRTDESHHELVSVKSVSAIKENSLFLSNIFPFIFYGKFEFNFHGR